MVVPSDNWYSPAEMLRKANSVWKGISQTSSSLFDSTSIFQHWILIIDALLSESITHLLVPILYAGLVVKVISASCSDIEALNGFWKRNFPDIIKPAWVHFDLLILNSYYYSIDILLSESITQLLCSPNTLC